VQAVSSEPVFEPGPKKFQTSHKSDPHRRARNPAPSSDLGRFQIFEVAQDDRRAVGFAQRQHRVDQLAAAFKAPGQVVR
jgi:hypothetical protein